VTRYISEPVAVDRGAVRTDMEDSLTSGVPGLEIPAGSVLDFLLDTFASNSAEDRELLTQQLAAIFRYSGEKIDRVAIREAVAATGVSTWTRSLTDAQAGTRTVDQATEINVTGLDGLPVAFQTTAPITFQASKAVSGVTVANPAVVTTSTAHGLATGQQVTISGTGGATAVNGTWTVTVLSGTTFSVAVNNTNAWTSGGTVYHVGTAAGAVGLLAVVAGEDGNGLQTGAAPAQTLTWLSAIALTAPTSGGVDGEDVDDYLDRLSDTRPLQLNAVAKGDDLARWLRNQTGVSRALALDNQNGASTGVAGHITAVPVDDSGAALGSPDMTALQTAAQAITLTNLQVHLIAPTYTTISVVFTGIAKTGWDATDVETRAETAVLDFLDRSRWGLPDTGDERIWLEKTVVRFQDVSTVLNNVEGFDHWTALTVNGGTSDVTLTGPGALPSSSSTAAGTVTV
jgi:hypothetical protein